VDVARQRDAALPVFGLDVAEPRQREQPHCEIMEILAVAVLSLPYAQSARTAEDALGIGHQPLGLGEPAFLSGFTVERDVEYDAEGVGPEIAQAVPPDPLGPHPVEPGEDVVDVAQHA
jgi:hypothetical protein